MHELNMSREGKGEFNNLYLQLREDDERFYTADLTAIYEPNV
jgi:hypothetical protein